MTTTNARISSDKRDGIRCPGKKRLRILENIGGEAEVISIQFIGTLLRQDLDPIDQANACVAFFQARQEGITLDAIIDALITFERDPARLDRGVAEIISAIAAYTGKSNRSIINGLTLLRLAERIRNDLKTGLVSPTIGPSHERHDRILLTCGTAPRILPPYLNKRLSVQVFAWTPIFSSLRRDTH